MSSTFQQFQYKGGMYEGQSTVLSVTRISENNAAHLTPQLHHLSHRRLSLQTQGILEAADICRLQLVIGQGGKKWSISLLDSHRFIIR